MKNVTKENVIIIFIILSIIMVIITDFFHYIDKLGAEECAKCSATYSWCDEYWKEHNMCGYGENNE